MSFQPLALFGEERLIFGTNWPVSEIGAAESDSIEMQIAIMEAFLAGKGEDARDKVMHDNAMRVYVFYVCGQVIRWWAIAYWRWRVAVDRRAGPAGLR